MTVGRSVGRDCSNQIRVYRYGDRLAIPIDSRSNGNCNKRTQPDQAWVYLIRLDEFFIFISEHLITNLFLVFFLTLHVRSVEINKLVTNCT